MRPRGDIAAMSLADTVADVVETVHDSPCSRYPVCGNGLDDLRGFIHLRDLRGVDPSTPVARLVRPAPFLPATNGR